MGEVKQTNFRINTEDAEKFREFCNANGMNQAQGFDHIMQIIEMDKAKAAIPERALEVEEFERHAKALITAFLNSVEIAESSEERVLEKYQSLLVSKDEQIMKLQDELKIKEERSTEAYSVAKEAENKYITIEKAMKEAVESERKMHDSLKDKEEINSMLASRLKDLEQKILDYPTLKEKLDAANEELKNVKQTMRDNLKDAEIASERAALEKERALMAIEKEHKEKLQHLYEKIEELRQERADLKDQIRNLEKIIKE